MDTMPGQDASIAQWPLRRVGLRIHDMQLCIDYYTRLGFSVVRNSSEQEGDQSVGLGVDGREMLTLRPLAGGRRRPAHTAGLFHVAWLVADDAELGSFLQHALDQHIPIDGASDHLVSQALYLSDPEGNGIEVYSDRPRTQWPLLDGHLRMDTLPLDAPKLLRQAHDFVGFSPQHRLGHIHLNVGNLERSKAFYAELDMNLMIGIPGQANFLSWDGYHHHLGANLWAGRNVSPLAPDVYGLDFYVIHRPGLAPATQQDPDGITVVML